MQQVFLLPQIKRNFKLQMGNIQDVVATRARLLESRCMAHTTWRSRVMYISNTDDEETKDPFPFNPGKRNEKRVILQLDTGCTNF